MSITIDLVQDDENSDATDIYYTAEAEVLVDETALDQAFLSEFMGWRWLDDEYGSGWECQRDGNRCIPVDAQDRRDGKVGIVRWPETPPFATNNAAQQIVMSMIGMHGIGVNLRLPAQPRVEKQVWVVEVQATAHERVGERTYHVTLATPNPVAGLIFVALGLQRLLGELGDVPLGA